MKTRLFLSLNSIVSNDLTAAAADANTLLQSLKVYETKLTLKKTTPFSNSLTRLFMGHGRHVACDEPQ